LLVVDRAALSSGPYESRIYRVDPSTGNRSIVADITTSSSEGLFWAARQVGNTIFATTGTGLETINPTTGSVTPFAVTGVSFPGTESGFLHGLAALGGDLYVASFPDLYKINIATGLGSVLASSDTGNGLSIGSFDVSVDSAGNLYTLNVGGLLANRDGTLSGTGGVTLPL
jgi:adhesin HecA-like repeat protein